MNDRITLGAAVLVSAVLAVRWALTPVRDTTPYDDDHDTVVTPLADLMGAWDWDWEPVYGVALAQASRCRPCDRCLTPAGAGAAS